MPTVSHPQPAGTILNALRRRGRPQRLEDYTVTALERAGWSLPEVDGLLADWPYAPHMGLKRLADEGRFLTARGVPCDLARGWLRAAYLPDPRNGLYGITISARFRAAATSTDGLDLLDVQEAYLLATAAHQPSADALAAGEWVPDRAQQERALLAFTADLTPTEAAVAGHLDNTALAAMVGLGLP